MTRGNGLTPSPRTDRRPCGQLKELNGGGIEPRQARRSTPARTHPPSHEASRSNRRRFSLRRQALAGLRACERLGFRRFLPSTASQPLKASAFVDLVLAYRCGAAPDSTGFPFQPRGSPRAPSRIRYNLGARHSAEELDRSNAKDDWGGTRRGSARLEFMVRFQVVPSWREHASRQNSLP